MTRTVENTAALPTSVPARRTLLAAAAWTAPTAIIAMAAPAMAASPAPDLTGVDVYSGGSITSNQDQTIWTLDWSLNFRTGNWPSTTDIPAGAVTVTVTVPEGSRITLAEVEEAGPGYHWTMDWNQEQNVVTFTNATPWPPQTWTIQTDHITVMVESTTPGAVADPPVAVITPEEIVKQGAGWEA